MVEKDSVRRSYDELADTYADERSEDERALAILERFLDSPDEPERVLDAGCGGGTPVLERLDRETGAVGVDFSREQLGLASAAVPDAALAQADMTRLPFADDSFDAVVAYYSLIHVPLEEHPAVLEEFARVLRPGGRALVCEGSGEEWIGENPDWLDTGVEMGWEIAGAEATAEGLREAGFTVVDEWSAAERLADESDDANDGEGDDETDADDDYPWTFFAARRDG